MSDPLILVAGGDQDPNLRALATTLEARGRNLFFLQVGASRHPWIHWRLDDDRLVLDGHEIRPRAAFLRYDVFTHQADGRRESAHRASAWYTAVAAWVTAHPEVRCLNRAGRFGEAQKPSVLCFAREAGLAIPDTLVNTGPMFRGLRPSVERHGDGGDGGVPGGMIRTQTAAIRRPRHSKTSSPVGSMRGSALIRCRTLDVSR